MIYLLDFYHIKIIKMKFVLQKFKVVTCSYHVSVFNIKCNYLLNDSVCGDSIALPSEFLM